MHELIRASREGERDAVRAFSRKIGIKSNMLKQSNKAVPYDLSEDAC